MAATLDQSGHFVLPALQLDTPYLLIDAERARALAVAYLATFGTNAAFLAPLQTQHGAPIVMSGLSAAPRVEVAQSPYAPVPEAYATYLRRSFAPRFLVRFLDRQTPAVTVSVSAYATDMEIAEGLLVYPVESGGEFQSWGNHITQGFDPISPERATEVVARATGALIAQVPRFIGPDYRSSAAAGKWMVVLDRDVMVELESTGERVSVRTLYVGLRFTTSGRSAASVFAASATQPAADSVLSKGEFLALQIAPGYPTSFEAVRVGIE